MPLLGAHMSIEGGLHMAFDRISHVEGKSLQIFSKNQRQWRVPALTSSEIELFIKKREQWGKGPVAAHDSYLINLANPDETKANRAVGAFAEEIRRADQLAVPYLIMHPGSHVGSGTDKGLLQLTANLDRAFVEAGNAKSVVVLLETTAGQGTGLGANFEEIAYVMENSAYSKRLGVCFDTCHAFAAGYDLSTKEGVEKTIEEMDKNLGLDRLKVIHLNDSKYPLGSRKDRHMHIGKGYIGLESFKVLVNNKYLKDLPFILERPKHDEKDDQKNIDLVKSLINTGDGSLC